MNEKVEIIKKTTIKKGPANLKKTAWTSVFESVITIILGILLIALSGTIVRVIAYAAGSFLVIKGLYQIINYLIVKGQNNFFNNDLLWGIITLLLGVVIFVMGSDIENVFRVIMGVWIIYEGLVRMNNAIKMNSIGVASWRYMLLMSIVMLVLGIFVVFTSGAVFALIGWLMVISGLISIFSDIMFMQNFEKISSHINGSEK